MKIPYLILFLLFTFSCSGKSEPERDLNKVLDTFIGQRMETAVLVFGSSFSKVETSRNGRIIYNTYDFEIPLQPCSCKLTCYTEITIGKFCVSRDVTHIVFQATENDVITAWSSRN
jgi:hypothetical protein